MNAGGGQQRLLAGASGLVILSDREIEDALASGRIVIEPLLDPELQVQPCSVDLRLSGQFALFRPSVTPYIDPELHDSADLTELVEVSEGETFVVHPGEFVLGSTIERVQVPDDLLAKVDGRSSLGRLAILVHATAGFIDPGFSGTVTLEISNVGRLPVALRPGMRICQISFEQLTSAARRPYGSRRHSKYQNQSGPTPSRIRQDER